MPQTGRETGANLAIQLVDPPLAYCAGDVVIGKVIRKSHVVSPRGWVTVKLFGRAKSKIRRRNGNNSHTIYRGRYFFFSPRETGQKIFDGPIHVAPAGEPSSWSFAITIPQHANPAVLRPSNQQEHTLISLKPEDIVNHPLPATFAASHYGFGPDFEAYVEYWVEAELHRDGHVDKATFPIKVRRASTLTPVADLPTKSINNIATVSSLRMVPGMEDAEFSFKQKAQKFFGSSKVPHLSFTTQLLVPGVIQLEHPTPISFGIRAVPRLEQTSEIIRDVPQTITLESFRLDIRSNTFVTTPSHGFSSRHTAEHQDEVPLGFGAFFPELKRQGPIVVPQGADAEYLNIGEHLELMLDARHVYAYGRRVFTGMRTIYPSFTTYNIKHSHRLEWSLTLAVAGETHKIKGSWTLVVLPPSEEQEAKKMITAGKQPAMTRPEDVPQYEVAVGGAEELPSYQEAAENGSSSREHDAAGALQPGQEADVKMKPPEFAETDAETEVGKDVETEGGSAS